jgi:hypothetical protein
MWGEHRAFGARHSPSGTSNAGKTIMARLYIRELIMRADSHRILIIVPGWDVAVIVRNTCGHPGPLSVPAPSR